MVAKDIVSIYFVDSLSNMVQSFECLAIDYDFVLQWAARRFMQQVVQGQGEDANTLHNVMPCL